MVKVAVIGVMDSVGREIVNFLAEDGFKYKDVFALEPKMPIGSQVSYGEDDELDVLNADEFDFSKVNFAIFATSTEVSKKYIPKALAKNVKVIDCSDHYFTDPDVPMIVGGINESGLKAAKKNLVCIPNALVFQMLLPLKKVDETYSLTRIISTSYISASIYGQKAMDELFNQTKKIFMNESLYSEEKVFKKQVAFNVIPQVGDFLSDETKLEWDINSQAKKILQKDIKVHANCAIVPAFIGSAQYINIESEKDIDVDDVKKLMEQTKGVVVFDKHVDGGYFSLTDVQGESEIYISRLRQDVSVENGISFWVVADNLQAGVAKNAFNVLKIWSI